MREYALISKTSDCKNCYKCIRSCPVKSISFADNKAKIVHEDCVLCGKCYNVCPQNLKIVRDDIEVVKGFIKSGSKMVVSLAPSFVSEYQHSSLVGLKECFAKLGFAAVEETAIGATIVKKAYDEMLDEKHDIIISSCCHSINLLIQKHYPEALPYLADVLSPMLAHGKDIKVRMGQETKVVFVGPCIAKKDEADRNGEYIDAVLTYQELNKWLAEEGIEIPEGEILDNKENSKARLFPTCGGILDTMECKNEDFTYIAVDGAEEAKHTLEDVISGKVHKCFIEMSSCKGSCINGPMVDVNKNGVISPWIEIKKFAGKKDFSEQVLTSKDINRRYNEISVSHAMPGENEINDMLVKMGKADPKKRLNCGSCGYNSCREKAIAVIRGKAVVDMCLPALIEKTQSFAGNVIDNSPNGIVTTDEQFNIVLMNKTMAHIIGLADPKFAIGNNISAFLDPENFARALGGERIVARRMYLPEYDKYVEVTFSYDSTYKIIIAIYRDITARTLEKQKRAETLQKSIEIADKIVAKHMMAVQEIASLLGESTAETKVALSSLKDTLKDENK